MQFFERSLTYTSHLKERFGIIKKFKTCYVLNSHKNTYSSGAWHHMPVIWEAAARLQFQHSTGNLVTE